MKEFDFAVDISKALWQSNPLQLKIAPNQSAGRRISVLLKCINVKCSEQIDGWQDSKSIDIDPLFDITSWPILISCAFVLWAIQCWSHWKKKYLPLEQGLWRTAQMTWPRYTKSQQDARLYSKIHSASDLLCCFMAPYLQGFSCLHFRVKYCCLSIYSSLQQPLVVQLPLNFTRVWMLPYRVCDPRHTLQHKQSSVEVQ